MNWQKTLTFALCVSFAASAAWAQCCGSTKCDDKKPAAAKADAKAAPAAEKAPETVKPATAPAQPKITMPPLPEVVATVGDTVIPGAKVERILKSMPANIPPMYMAQMRQRIIGQMIMQALVDNYTKSQKVEASKEEYDKIMAQLEDAAKKANSTVEELMKKVGMTEKDIKAQARTMELVKLATSPEKVEKFVKDNPTFFNGTEVRASHILVSCQPTAPTVEQKAAIEKLKKIEADIKAGKITFADAANKFSQCPSSQQKGKDGKGSYGDLGFFKYNQMVPSFATAAFNAKVGDMTGIVRSNFGFHLIKVTDRKEGKGPQDPMANQFAKNALEGMLQDKVFEQALTTCPITVNIEKPAAKKVTTKSTK